MDWILIGRAVLAIVLYELVRYSFLWFCEFLTFLGAGAEEDGYDEGD